MQRVVALPGPVHLPRLLSPLRLGKRDATMRVTRGEAVRASHTPAGPATLHLRVVGSDLHAEAWGGGAEWVLDRAPRMVGADDDPDAFDPVTDEVARLWHRSGGVRLGASGLVYDVLVPTILGQKVTGIEAKRAWHALVRRFGEPAPGPGDLALRLPPDAASTAGIPSWEWHTMGVERKRADTIARACRRIDRLEEAATMEVDDSYRRLTALPGLGPWTAAIIRRVSFGDPDAVEVGDFHLPNLVTWNLAGEARGDDERMLELLEPWRGQRGRLLRLLEVAGAAPPRFGPRMEARRIEAL